MSINTINRVADRLYGNQYALNEFDVQAGRIFSGEQDSVNNALIIDQVIACKPFEQVGGEEL